MTGSSEWLVPKTTVQVSDLVQRGYEVVREDGTQPDVMDGGGEWYRSACARVGRPYLYIEIEPLDSGGSDRLKGYLPI